MGLAVYRRAQPWAFHSEQAHMALKLRMPLPP
jgi:hypothetical protein